MWNLLIPVLTFAAGAWLTRRPTPTIVNNTSPAQPAPTTVPATVTPSPAPASQPQFPLPLLPARGNAIPAEALVFVQPPRYESTAEIPVDLEEKIVKMVHGMNGASIDSLYAGFLPENYPELLERKIDQAILAELIAERKYQKVA